MASVWDDKDTKKSGRKTNSEVELTTQKRLENEPLLDAPQKPAEEYYQTKVYFQREIGHKEAMFICFFLNYIIVRATQLP